MTTQVAQILDHDASTVIRSIANDWAGQRLLDWTGSGSNLRYYGTNGHHDVSWTADASGVVTATLRYDPWGNLTSSTGSSLPDFRFQGSWYDTTTSLSWVVARWYAPSLGRFVSEDALLGQAEDPPSRHLYQYSSGEPIARWDPLGTYWYRINSPTRVDIAAGQTLGMLRRWKSLVNANRGRLPQAATSSFMIAAGQCLDIPVDWLSDKQRRFLYGASVPRDQCVGVGNRAVRVDDPDYRGRIFTAQRAAKGYPGFVDPDVLFNFTRSDLIMIVDIASGHRPKRPADASALPRVADANRLARFFFSTSNPRASWIDGVRFVDPPGVPGFSLTVPLGCYLVVGCLNYSQTVKPAFGRAATVGQFIFINGSTCMNRLECRAHEYVHVVQWEGLGLDYLKLYLAEFALTGGGEANNVAEAPAYLWDGWAKYFPADPPPWKIWWRPGLAPAQTVD